MAKKSSTKNKSTLQGTNAADVLTVKHKFNFTKLLFALTLCAILRNRVLP